LGKSQRFARDCAAIDPPSGSGRILPLRIALPEENDMKRVLASVAVAAIISFSPAKADDAAIGAAQSAIEGQLRAFLADDPETAYGYAAPNIKRIFPTQDAFMAMVRSAYRPVHQPQSFSFGPAEASADGKIAQRVQLTGPDGKDYEALYTLERHADGTFLITGVSLRASQSLGV
jgi:hypothetical protein